MSSLLAITQSETNLAISFFTFLTVASLAATVVIAALALVARTSDAPAAQEAWASVRTQLAGGGLALAGLVAGVSTSGSLFFSEVVGYVPCRLCWAQRACMYPLVVLLLAAWRWPWARLLALPLAGAGALVAVYHVLVERFPSLESGTCDPNVPCSLKWFEQLGFVTLPVMALAGFVFIITLLLASRPLDPFAEEISP